MYAAERKLLATEFKQREMSAAPADSDLKPVMGDGGLPVLGHMVEMFMNTPDFLSTCIAPADRWSMRIRPCCRP